ncbi:MAG TPA: cytochrome c3 family protein [Candidatus Krumholzibacteria bacterium]|nr:cytochrome c3 family protein [Candidatus Krumholzibacteria bacterium]
MTSRVLHVLPSVACAPRIFRRRIAVLATLLLSAALAAPLPVRAEPQRKPCVDCHQDFKKRLKAKYVHAPVKAECEQCHKRHGFEQKLVLTKDLPDLCIDCHAGVGEEMKSSHVHGALTQGGCFVCHDSHSADNPQLLRTSADGKPVCMECHKELAPKLTDSNAHDPFKKGNCTACHKPHASDRPHLAVADEATMCESCHKNVLDKHKKVVGAADQSCTDCHDPHVASKKMKLASLAHPPFAEGDCGSCHTVTNGEVEIPDNFPPADLCETCHDDIAAKVAGNESHFGNDARKNGGTATCLTCHDPHRSHVEKLLLKPQDELCRSCHEKLPQKASFQGAMHPPFAEGKCTSCHDPHGGGGAHHLAQASSSKLCGSCHENIVAAAKPGETRHAALDAADCLDCHSGHASAQPAMLKKPEGDICTECHDKTHFPVTHPPYLLSKCGACHQNHSHNSKLLAGNVTATCNTCHPEEASLAAQARFPHPPAHDDNCLSCHAGHGSDNAGILKQPQKQLCADCHDVTDLTVKTSREASSPTHLHAPVAKGNCSGCHNAHGSPTKGLLNRNRDDLCYGCHTQEKVAFAAGNTHKPVFDGSCDVCHTPHGSTGDALRLKSEPELCTQCHDLAKPPLNNAHQGFDVSASQCTSCHAPHNSERKHLLNPVVHPPFDEGDCEACHEGGKDASGKMAAVSPTVCLDCHDEKTSDPGHQHVKGVTCTGCHQPHSSRNEHLLKDPGRLCQSCHQDVLQLGSARTGDGAVAGAGGASAPHVHPPVQQGRCLDCHQMHKPAADKFLAKAPGTLCASCHADIGARATDKTQHNPFAKGNCSACHEVHVSENDNLLKKSGGAMCVTCHGLTTPRMTAAHKIVPLSGRTCTSCHDPHSTKQAKSKLVYPNQHPPFKDKECDTCHAADGKVTATPSTCADCHDNAQEFKNTHNAGRKDATARIDVCLDCHSPHAGFDKLLVRPTEAQTCMQCHDRREFTRKNVHAALEEGCTTCHDVHDRDAMTLRGARVNEVCGQCHDAAKTHAHKTGAPAKDPRTGQVLTCVSCHQPHSSDFDHLTRFDEKRDLCVQCHAAGMEHDQ